MRIQQIVAVALIAFPAMLSTVLPSRAQSLADLARQEEARRRITKPAAKVYTNGDLGPAPQSSEPSTGDSPSGTPSTTPPPADPAGSGSGASTPLPAADVPARTDGDTAADAAAAPTPPRNEAYWRGRLKGLREQFEQNESYAEAMQSRINALTTDFTNRDDPAQRARIGVERQKALADLDRLKRALEAGKKAIADLMEEGRRAGVPAGWLR